MIFRLSIAAISFVVAAAAAPSHASEPNGFGRFSNLKIVESGSDSSGSACPGFPVTAGGARNFFAKAVAITPTQLHDRYNFGPCYTRGTMSVGAETWRWEMRAGGTARVFPAHGAAMLFADPQQQDSLAQ